VPKIEEVRTKISNQLKKLQVRYKVQADIIKDNWRHPVHMDDGVINYILVITKHSAVQ